MKGYEIAAYSIWNLYCNNPVHGPNIMRGFKNRLIQLTV